MSQKLTREQQVKELKKQRGELVQQIEYAQYEVDDIREEEPPEEEWQKACDELEEKLRANKRWFYMELPWAAADCGFETGMERRLSDHKQKLKKAWRDDRRKRYKEASEQSAALRQQKYEVEATIRELQRGINRVRVLWGLCITVCMFLSVVWLVHEFLEVSFLGALAVVPLGIVSILYWVAVSGPAMWIAAAFGVVLLGMLGNYWAMVLFERRRYPSGNPEYPQKGRRDND